MVWQSLVGGWYRCGPHSGSRAESHWRVNTDTGSMIPFSSIASCTRDATELLEMSSGNAAHSARMF